MKNGQTIEGFKVFSATKHADRVVLGERVTEWLASSKVEIVDTWIKQSSDSAFHCISIIVAYRKPR